MLNLQSMVIMTGRLTKDVDFRMVDYGKNPFGSAKFNLAVKRGYNSNASKDEATVDFIPCEATGKLAEFINNNFHKGDVINIVGTIETYKAKLPDGSYPDYANAWKIKVDQASFVLGAYSKREEGETQTTTQPNNNPFANAQPSNPFTSTGDLPFDASFMGGNSTQPNNNPFAVNNGFGGNTQTGAAGTPDFSTTFVDEIPFI